MLLKDRGPSAEVFDVMIVLDKCWTDEDGDVVDYKTVEHEVLGSFKTEDEAREFIASLQNGSADPHTCSSEPT